MILVPGLPEPASREGLIFLALLAIVICVPLTIAVLSGRGGRDEDS